MEKQHRDNRQLVAERREAAYDNVFQILRLQLKHLQVETKSRFPGKEIGQPGNSNQHLRGNRGIGRAGHAAAERKNENIVHYDVQQQSADHQPHRQHRPAVVTDYRQHAGYQHISQIAVYQNPRITHGAGHQFVGSAEQTEYIGQKTFDDSHHQQAEQYLPDQHVAEAEPCQPQVAAASRLGDNNCRTGSQHVADRTEHHHQRPGNGHRSKPEFSCTPADKNGIHDTVGTDDEHADHRRQHIRKKKSGIFIHRPLLPPRQMPVPPARRRYNMSPLPAASHRLQTDRTPSETPQTPNQTAPNCLRIFL